MSVCDRPMTMDSDEMALSLPSASFRAFKETHLALVSLQSRQRFVPSKIASPLLALLIPISQSPTSPPNHLRAPASHTPSVPTPLRSLCRFRDLHPAHAPAPRHPTTRRFPAPSLPLSPPAAVRGWTSMSSRWKRSRMRKMRLRRRSRFGG